ncbi:hypothetical protein VTI74DRAFT_2981 [Chaetomium olivicolor]
MRDITELPHDLFLLVIAHLSPRTCVRCRAVSRRWHAAFTSEVVSLLLLRWNFPRCRELRLATAAASLSSSPTPLPRNLVVELRDVAARPPDWPTTFADVARRYYHLNRAKARVVEKLDMARDIRENGPVFSFWGVASWNRFLRLGDRTSNFHYPDPVWSYSQEDGVLVYPAALSADGDLPPGQCEGYVYHVLDLSSGQRVPVPFDVRSKHIRRVRLAQGVLVLEWAEALPYHQLNDREVVHRHFVTAFDVIRKPSVAAPEQTWTVEFRSEWKLHFLGLPLNRSDRFFSAHTATHYAVYFWQPNRSLYQDDPIEQLAVWDISTPSAYRPSEDPKGDKRPSVLRTPSLPSGLWHGQNGTATSKMYRLVDSNADLERPKRALLRAATAGPQVIRRMAWRDLDFYGLRQRATPQLRSLALDDWNLFVIEEEHRWADGQHSSLNPPRAHLVRSTGIPIVPMPASPSQTPHSVNNRSASDLNTEVGRLDDLESVAMCNIIDGPVYGPIWVDSCGADGDVNMSFCRHVAGANETPVSETASGTRPPPPVETDTLHVDGLEILRTRIRQRLSALASTWPWVPSDDLPSNAFAPLESSRWPGSAPCWRHEDFPYLTITEMVDSAAGVRVTARNCFMLEAVSVHIRPGVSVQGTPPAIANQDDGGGAGSGRAAARRRSSSGEAISRRGQEEYFPEDMWWELLAKGHIAGDERWIVGEDEKGRITVVRF